jgi:hypothetical protein
MDRLVNQLRRALTVFRVTACKTQLSRPRQREFGADTIPCSYANLSIPEVAVIREMARIELLSTRSDDLNI